MVQLTKSDIDRLLRHLDKELGKVGAQAELNLVGGAVMCLVLDARASTQDVDAQFHPTRVVREAAARVAASSGMPDTWLNDAVKGFLSPKGSFDPYLELEHLSVFVADPRYLLAMKCAALRLGEEFHDLDDVRFLLRYLNLSSASEVLEIITRYYSEDQLPVKSRLALEELLPG